MTKLGAAALYNTGPLKFTAGYRYNKGVLERRHAAA
jgi:hypothetical protein